MEDTSTLGYVQSKEERSRALKALAKMKELEAKHKKKLIEVKLDSHTTYYGLTEHNVKRAVRHHKEL